MRRIIGAKFAAVVCLLGITVPLCAQVARLSGTAGVYGELYGIEGREGRRDPSLGRLYIRPTLTVLGMNFPFEIYVSTEETRFRQSFNRIGIDPQWKWITFHVGDFYPQMGSYISGIRVRGLGVDLRPGIFRLSAWGGRAQRAVPGSAYRRDIWGVLIGLGREHSNYFDLFLIMATDDTSSLQDSIAFGVTPQQNLVIGTRGQISLFRHRFSVRVEAAGGLHTRDLRSASTDSMLRKELPSGFEGVYDALSGVFEPRLSTRADYAFRLEMRLRLSRFQFTWRTARVGPGFVSLAMPYTVNDRKQTDFRGAVRLIPGKMTLTGQYTTYRDNLQDDKDRTTGRNSWNAALQIRPWRSTSVRINYGGGVVVREDSLRTEFEGQRSGLRLTQRFHFLGRAMRIQLNFTQRFSRRWRGEYDIANLVGYWDLDWSRGFSTGLSFGSASNKYLGERIRLTIVGARARYRSLKGRLTNRFSIRFRIGSDYISSTTGMNMRWRLSPSAGLSLSVRHTIYSRSGLSYRETLARLSLDYRFGR